MSEGDDTFFCMMLVSVLLRMALSLNPWFSFPLEGLDIFKPFSWAFIYQDVSSVGNLEG